MPAVRILVCDDSVVIRKLLTQTLNEVPGMEVVATAALGKIALSKIQQCSPDVVILDVEMPEMDGIETLKKIRVDWPKLPVIMFSTKTERGAAATIEALTSGASDYVTKPSNVGSVVVAMTRVREQMVPKIQALVSGQKTIGSRKIPVVAAAAPPLAVARPATPIVTARPTGPRPPIDIVAIGASTGGPAALSEVICGIPADFPVPIVIVQHMLATFTKHFADRLASSAQIGVVEAQAGDTLVPGKAYIARGDYHMAIERKQGRGLVLANQDPPENYCRPAVDVLFRSVARVYGASALAVVLTGMGQDGLLGCGAIREAGGDVIVQDEATSVVWGMPGFVARAGLASDVLPLARIGSEVRRRVAVSGARDLRVGSRV
jgi:two-component system chemotaxis response regulator CheB